MGWGGGGCINVMFNCGRPDVTLLTCCFGGTAGYVVVLGNGVEVLVRKYVKIKHLSSWRVKANEALKPSETFKTPLWKTT